MILQSLMLKSSLSYHYYNVVQPVLKTFLPSFLRKHLSPLNNLMMVFKNVFLKFTYITLVMFPQDHT